jgi:signal transduction histidine kinase
LNFLALLCIISQPVCAAEHPRRIFFLESLSPAQPAAVRTIEAFKQRLSEKTTENFEIFVDYMEAVRFPSQAHTDRTVEYLSGKYAEAPPDILIALGRAAIPFLTKYRNVIAPNVPTIIASVPSKAVPKTDLTDFLFVATEYSFAKTMELARQLQPDARKLVVISGAGDYDRQWLDDARRELQPYSDRYTTKYITDLPLSEILKAVSQLSKDTIAIMSFFFVDNDGVPRLPPDVAENVAKVSSAPVYSPISSYFGRGIVGGYMDSWEEEGVATADLALQILSGKTEIPRQITTAQAYQIDDRQLQRWGISKSKVPPVSNIQFRDFDPWERHHWEIISILAALFAQAAIIAALFLERRRRKVAELKQRQRLMEVIHLNRTAVAGALSASVAHELNQPLGAIQSYAEAAMLYLKTEPPNIARAVQILDNILRDDQRAAEIITHLRGLLKKKDESELHEFDLNEVIGDALQIVGPEAIKKGVEVSAYRTNGALPVRGDKIQVQQVVLNLAMNGLDAMQEGDTANNKMSIKTALVDNTVVEVSVVDTGAGIPPERLNKIFDAFYTTKRQGTGLGLSIARTIIETYGGKIWAENRASGGAMFCFTLPLSKAIAA